MGRIYDNRQIHLNWNRPMSSRLSTLFLLTAAICFGYVTNGMAGTYPVGDTPIAVITIPESWKVKDIDRGLQAATKDDEVYFWAEVFPADGLKDLMAEHDAYYTKQGVDAGSGDPTTKVIKVNGVDAALIHIVSPTWKGKPTVLEYVLFDPTRKTGRKLMLSYWASPEGDKLYEADLTSMLTSVKFKAE
jgi:hypothetical protein